MVAIIMVFEFPPRESGWRERRGREMERERHTVKERERERHAVNDRERETHTQ